MKGAIIRGSAVTAILQDVAAQDANADREGQQSSPDTGSLETAYGVLTNRRATFDTLMWQVPVLGLAAQAFLLTIALGHDTSHTARLIAAVLAFLISAISIQTMGKWRQAEVVDSILIADLEARLGIDRALGIAPHGMLRERAAAVNRRLPWWSQASSYRLWMSVLALFAAASVLVAVLTAAKPSLF